jgi:hypothetical protein
MEDTGMKTVTHRPISPTPPMRPSPPKVNTGGTPMAAGGHVDVKGKLFGIRRVFGSKF